MYASRAASYLSDEPATCVKTSWHLLYHMGTTARMEEMPHATIVIFLGQCIPQILLLKAKDGMRHASIFAIRGEAQVIQAMTESANVIMENCIRCHAQLEMPNW